MRDAAGKKMRATPRQSETQPVIRRRRDFIVGKEPSDD